MRASEGVWLGGVPKITIHHPSSACTPSQVTDQCHTTGMTTYPHLHDEVEQREGDVEGDQEDQEQVGDVLLGAGGTQAHLPEKEEARGQGQGDEAEASLGAEEGQGSTGTNA